MRVEPVVCDGTVDKKNADWIPFTTFSWWTRAFDNNGFLLSISGPRQANLVLIAYASSEGSDKVKDNYSSFIWGSKIFSFTSYKSDRYLL